MRRSTVLLATMALLVLGAAPAGAQSGDGPVVARDGDAVLRARERGADFCVTLREPSGGGASCAEGGVRLFAPQIIATRLGEPSAVGGAVDASVLTVELETADGRVAIATVADPAFPQERFFVAASVAPATVARLYDAAGTLIAAADLGTASAVLATAVVRRAAHARRVVARVERTFEPTPLVLDRFAQRECLAATGAGSESICLLSGLTAGRLTVRAAPGCAARPGLVYGFVGEGVAGVRVTFGDGSVRVARARALPPAFGALQAIALPYRPGLAVRSATALGADGTAGRTRALRQGPGPRRCRDVKAGATSYGPAFRTSTPVGPAALAAEADGARLLAADGDNGSGLCLAVDREPASCTDPVADPELTLLRRTGDVVYGAVPARVARVRLFLRGGRSVETAAVAPVAYAGSYRDALHFVLARVPAGREILAAILVDRTGTELDTPGIVLAPQRQAAPRRLLRTGGVSLWVGRLRGGGLAVVRRPLGCLRLERGTTFPGCHGLAGGVPGVTAVSTCGPRRVVVLGTLRRTGPVPVVRLAGGRTLTPVVVRVPAALGGGRAWLARVPRRAAVRAVVRSGDQDALRVPPASEQCGYRVSP
jgi:hypothetical protein